MEQQDKQKPEQNLEHPVDVRAIIRDAIKEFVSLEQAKAEPAYKAELVEERRRREQLESRVNELVQENRAARDAAEEAQRSAAIRTELQKLGVTKIDLAYKAIKDDVYRTAQGQLAARGDDGETTIREYLSRFVAENPELLPARISGGSGMSNPQKPVHANTIDLDRIKPGMSAEELERARQEIARIAQQTGLNV
jgi:hypothetical protein